MQEMEQLQALFNETIELINKLNNIYFDIVREIYSINFNSAKSKFLQSDELVLKLVQNAAGISQLTNGEIILDASRINSLLEEVIIGFEKNDMQNVADVLLYDFSDLINEYAEKLEYIE